MNEEPLYIRRARAELKRLELEEYERNRIKEIEADIVRRRFIKIEKYLNAPVMNLEGVIIGRKSLSTGEKT